METEGDREGENTVTDTESVRQGEKRGRQRETEGDREGENPMTHTESVRDTERQRVTERGRESYYRYSECQ